MFGLDILNVVIGIVFIFLLLSLACTAVCEMIEAWLKKRATYLEQGLRELLCDKGGKGLVTQFYGHPLIAGLFAGNYNPDKIRSKTFTNLPSYIPARNFALTLMDLVLHPPADASATGAGSMAAAKSTDGGVQGNTIPAATGGSGSTGSTGKTVVDAPAGSSDIISIESLRKAVDAFPHSEVNRALRAFLEGADNDVNKVRRSLEVWYDNSMERVTGWYKRHSQVIACCLGLVIAVVLNADTIAVVRSLSLDPALRNAVVAAASQYAKENPSIPSTASSSAPDSACAKDPASPACRFEGNLEQVKKLGLPIGWNWGDPRCYPGGFSGKTFLPWLFKVLGWFLTAFAVSLGAPFWFDVLSKFMVVRSTAKPRKKGQEELSDTQTNTGDNPGNGITP